MKLIPITGLAAAMLLAGCAGPTPQPVSTVPSMFDRPPTVADRARSDSIRASIARQLASGMNFRIAGTAKYVLIAHGVPSRIVVGPGNLIRISLVKSSRPQFALSVVDKLADRHPKFDPVEGSGDGDEPPQWLLRPIPGTTVDSSGSIRAYHPAR